jgi:CRISPR-associated protein (TIGR03986 family)
MDSAAVALQFVYVSRSGGTRLVLWIGGTQIMQKGKILNYNPNRGFGFIIPENGGDKVFFHITSVENGNTTLLTTDISVEYHAVKADREFKATSVKIIQQQEEPYRFLNPYNFVRFLHQPNTSKTGIKVEKTALAMALASAGLKEKTEHELSVLRNCVSPPYDRWVGYSGRITCSLEAKTPLFVSDSEKVEMDEKTGHKSYRFFRLDKKLAIPASSLRGMLRNVYEAVTNSCFSVFDSNRRLSYRMKAADSLNLTPALVTKNADDSWVLRLLPGTSQLEAGQAATSIDIQPAAWIFRYPKSANNRRNVVSIPEGLKHGSSCWAVMVEEDYCKKGKKLFKYWNVVELFTSEQDATNYFNTVQVNQNQRKIYAEGWLYLSGKTIENKHDERFFFRSANVKLPETVIFKDEKRQEYESLVTEYKDNHEKNLPQKMKEYSKFIIDAWRLNDCRPKDGDLVYAKLKGPNDNPTVDFVTPVSISRLQYQRSLSSFIPEYLHKCELIETLCPACRLFGWVKEEPQNSKSLKNNSQKQQVARVGRLKFTNALLTTVNYKYESIPVNVLSQPKPTTGYFYLWPKEGINLTRIINQDYHADAWIRGRKFYRYNPELKKEEYILPGTPQDDQSRTLCDVLIPAKGREIIFEFEIFFDNLSKVELGALLWSLTLDNKGYHRLGYAKPYGFGSVLLSINSLEVRNNIQRYTQLGCSGYRKIDKIEQQRLIADFKDEMAGIYDNDFDKLHNIVDMFSILGVKGSKLPIHYPRSQRKALSEDDRKDTKKLNFNWFIGNKRTKLKDGTPRNIYYPKRAVEDTEGLGLVDKNGCSVN